MLQAQTAKRVQRKVINFKNVIAADSYSSIDMAHFNPGRFF